MVHQSQTKHTKIVKEHFDLSYKDYDQMIEKLAPGYPDLIESVLTAIKETEVKEATILDLGSGTAILGEAILTLSDNFVYYGVDISSSMINEAKKRLARFGDRAKLIQEDFFKIDKSEFPSFNILISVLAIHHFDNKFPIYKLANQILGQSKIKMFVLSDLVVDPQKNKQVYQTRRQHMASYGMTEKEIDDWFEVFNSEDKPSTIEENLELLSQAGFQAKVTWQNHSYATFVCKLKKNNKKLGGKYVH
jgi:ubiquinone/menaquinone biosynthesis C-methylase UbiE